MKHKKVLVAAIIILVFSVFVIVQYYKNHTDKTLLTYSSSVDDPQDYSTSVPEEIKESIAWHEYTESEYYSNKEEHIFKSVDDRIVCELYHDDYYVYIEYVFGELTIDVIDSSTMETIVRFE